MSRQLKPHIDDPIACGSRLSKARTARGMSQRQLAAAVGCSPTYISRMEAGLRTGSLQLLRELARLLHISEAHLAWGDAGGSPDAQRLDAEIALRLDNLPRARELYEALLEAARSDDDRSATLEALGQIALREGRTEDAIGVLEESLRIAGGDPSARPPVAEALARAYGARGQLAPAVALLQACADRFERERDAVQFVKFAGLLGCALTDAGSFADAERVLAKALDHGRSVTDPYTRARLYWSQSRLLAEQGRNEAAEAYARQTLDTLRATEDTYAIAHVLETLAHICVDLGRADEALTLLREGWPLAVSSGTPIELAHFRVEEARALAATGQSEAAAQLAMEVAGQLKEGQPADAGRAFVLLGEIFDDLGDEPRAREVMELGIELLAKQGPSRYLFDAYKRLAELLKRAGQRDEALDVLERALGVQQAAGRPLT